MSLLPRWLSMDHCVLKRGGRVIKPCRYRRFTDEIRTGSRYPYGRLRQKVGDRIVIPTLALGTAVTFATGGNIVRGVGVITLDIGTGVRVSVPTAIPLR